MTSINIEFKKINQKLIKDNHLLRLGDILFNSDDGSQAYLIFQSVRRYFKTDNNSAYISEWESKGISNKGIKPPNTDNDNLTPQINYYGHHLRAIFSGSCLQQSKIDQNNEKISFYIVYELRTLPSSSINDPTLQNCLFGIVTLTKNADIEKYKYSSYGIGFDRRSSFSFPRGGFGQNILIFGVDMSSSIHIDNKKKYILVLVRGPTRGLKSTLTAEKTYSINFTVTQKEFCLSLHYNGANSYLLKQKIQLQQVHYVQVIFLMAGHQVI